MTEEQNAGSKILLINRKNISIDGVRDILAFDENELIVMTTLGNLIVEGQELHVLSLSVGDGKIVLEGKIDEICYLTEKEKKQKQKSFFKKG